MSDMLSALMTVPWVSFLEKGVQKPRFQVEKHLRNSFETLFQFVWIVVE